MIIDKKLYRILVIEDNPGDLALVEDFLKEYILNPQIEHAINYKQAAEILKSSKLFDVILLDISLTDKSGHGLVTEMLKISSSVPIIVLTGYADRDFSIKSISLGISDYLIKDDLNANFLYKSIIYTIERHRNLSALKASEKRSSDLFNLSPQPMWVYDRETYGFIQVNDAAIQHYGYTRAEFLSMTILDIRPDYEISTTKRIVEELKGMNDEVHQGRYLHKKKSGEVFEVELFSSPISINGVRLRSVIAVDITERTLVEQKVTKAIIKTQEEERYEMGAELHDNVCQILSAGQIGLDMLKENIPPSKMHLFTGCKKYLQLALEEIRNLSHRLAPVFLDQVSLEDTFRKLFHSINQEEKYDIRIHIGSEIDKYELNPDIHLNLYRILQEQIRNIQKYSSASKIEVDLIVYKGKLRMKISDNGIGFQVKEITGGIGMANMKRRAELFSGIFEVVSSPGNGCAIYVEIPLGNPTKQKSLA